MSDQPRLATLEPGGLDPDQRDLYDAIVGGPRGAGPQHFPLVDEAGGLRGPFNAMLLSPAVGGPVQQLGSAIRFVSALTEREREMAILVVAGHWGSAFERDCHVAIGRAAGLTEDELDDALSADSSRLADEREAAVVEVVGALVANWTLTDPKWSAAVDVVGRKLLFELTTLVGYYSMLALQLRVFGDEY